MGQDKIRIAMLGAGLIAPIHAAGFQEMADQAEVAWVCDTDEEKARDLAGLFDARVTTDYREAIADPGVDLVDVLLPHHLHLPVARDVFAGKKHLLIEKPLALTYADALAICHQAQEAGLCLMVAENTRYIQAYRAAEEIVRSGKLGEISLVRTFLPANERIRLSSPDFWGKKRAQGGGALIDSGPHSFYLLNWLFGPVREVAAFTGTLYRVGSEVEDNADVIGALESRARFLSSFTFTAEIPHSERLEIYGSQGSLIVDQLADPVVKYFADPTDYEGSPVEGVESDPMGWHYFSIVEEVKDAIRTLAEGTPPLVDPLDCAEAVRVIEAAYQSVRSGGRPVLVSSIS